MGTGHMMVIDYDEPAIPRCSMVLEYLPTFTSKNGPNVSSIHGACGLYSNYSLLELCHHRAMSSQIEILRDMINPSHVNYFMSSHLLGAIPISYHKPSVWYMSTNLGMSHEVALCGRTNHEFPIVPKLTSTHNHQKGWCKGKSW